MKFLKLPITVEAVQWKPSNAFGQFHRGVYQNHRIGTDKHGVEYTVCDVGLRTDRGFMHIRPGDWIITGIKGERYVCDREIFAATYERVSGGAK